MSTCRGGFLTFELAFTAHSMTPILGPTAKQTGHSMYIIKKKTRPVLRTRCVCDLCVNCITDAVNINNKWIHHILIHLRCQQASLGYQARILIISLSLTSKTLGKGLMLITMHCYVFALATGNPLSNWGLNCGRVL